MATSGVKHAYLFILIFHIVLMLESCVAKKPDGGDLVEALIDPKEMKKMLRTKNNVLMLFSKNSKGMSSLSRTIALVAEEMRGQATIVTVDCSGDGKKLCKKLKVSPEPLTIKHYKNGEFHKDYDRKLVFQSMVNFLKDPSGDVPWEEEDTAKDILHFNDGALLARMIVKEKNPVMVMFYAPWCGFCKRLKPEYEAAATELKGEAALAAIDVNKPENSALRKYYNITGFPTLLYFEGGKVRMKYDGDNNKEGLVSFMRSPVKQPKQQTESEWSDDILQLSDENFDAEIQSNPSLLVMFYAPWCGHCKKMKPEFIAAAAAMKEFKVPGTLASLDGTIEKVVTERYKVTGYPTVKYFKDGELLFDVNVRTAEKIVEYMRDPKEPPPPPPPEIPWSDVPSDVMHLKEEDFKTFLKRKKHVFLMFYAPWCGHCKKAKPEFEGAAAYFRDDAKVEFAAVDCIAHSAVCNVHNVRKYPTIKYFNYYKVEKLYEGRREESDFVEYMQALVDGKPLPTPAPPAPSEDFWKDLPGGENVKQLTDSNYDEAMASHDSALVMFYAPWCGHCKSMKPAFAEAATQLKESKDNVLLGAVDATVDRTLATKFDVKGFPTIKYFRKGEFVADYTKQRTAEELVSFVKAMTNPKEEL